MFGFDIDEVTRILKDESHPKFAEYSLLRSVAKRINFGIIYGVGAPGLSEQIKRPAKYENYSEDDWVAVCQSFIDLYLDKYVGVRRFINQGGRLVKRDAELTNYFGRVRHLPHAHACKLLKNENLFWMEKRAQRQGVNFLIQGTAADMFKIAVVRIHNILKGKKSKLVNFVHDEVQLYMHKDEMHLLPLIKKAMEDWKFSVPILAEFSSSTDSWGAKKALHI
jgi:DNA polymerase-1